MSFFDWMKRRKIAKARRLSQPFAVAVSDSMISDQKHWDFSNDEKCLINENSNLVCTVPQGTPAEMHINNYRSNGGPGSTCLAVYWRGSWDRWIVERAFETWKAGTALKRELERETRKAQAIVSLAA